MARVSDVFFLFSKNPSLKNKLFPFRGVKVTDDWLV